MMKRKRFILAGVVGVMLAISLSSAEQQPTSPADASGAIAAFISNYVSVVNAGDTNALVRLIHPKYLVCRTDETGPFYRYWFKRQCQNRIPADYTVQTGTWMGGATDLFYFPVPPTHWLYFNTHIGQTTRGWEVDLVCDTNGVFIAVPCPKPNIAEHYRKLEAAH
ncbi:MAG: hypothetical protein ABSG14_15300 [Verrucomicrobiia bacterium]|jgi:hypothetical protein